MSRTLVFECEELRTRKENAPSGSSSYLLHQQPHGLPDDFAGSQCLVQAVHLSGPPESQRRVSGEEISDPRRLRVDVP